MHAAPAGVSNSVSQLWLNKTRKKEIMFSCTKPLDNRIKTVGFNVHFDMMREHEPQHMIFTAKQIEFWLSFRECSMSATFQQFQNNFHLFNFRSLVQENPVLAAKNVYWCHLNSHHFAWSQ